MKVWKEILAAALVSLCGCTKAEAVEAPGYPDDMNLEAAVTSDLHFTLDRNAVDSIVPAEPYSKEFTETFASQIIASHPDVWILTGDNTNGGDPEDEEALAQILKRVEEAGIPVVMTTGNHDYNESDGETYRKNYHSLFHADSEDPASLSYRRDIQGFALLAMDDGAVDQGKTPVFSKETMSWLEEQLNSAMQEGKRVLFLAHRSVLYHKGDRKYKGYTLENEDLYDLLKKYHVQLLFTGHQHSQSILQKEDMHEIISEMPLSGKHRFGHLSIQGKKVAYQTVPIDFETYGNETVVKEMARADQKAGENTADTVDLILKKEKGSASYAGQKKLLKEIFAMISEGSIGAHTESIEKDPAWKDLHQTLADTNYGPWLDTMLEDPPADPYHLSFDFQ